jgi:hypothetical protein
MPDFLSQSVTVIRSARAFWSTNKFPLIASIGSNSFMLIISSFMDPFLPFGGFLSDVCKANSFAANSCPQALRCQQCNDRYEQEVATIIRGSGTTIDDNFQGGLLPSLLQNGSVMGPNNGFDAVKV